MKQVVFERQKYFANFFMNIGVAWFVAGVIGIFVDNSRNSLEIIKSLVWGLGFSLIFLVAGDMILSTRKTKRKWTHKA